MKNGVFDRFKDVDSAMFLVCLLRAWEIMGNNPALTMPLHLVCSFRASAVFCKTKPEITQNAVLRHISEQHLDINSHKKQLRPMYSHGIPNSRDESGNSKRGTQTSTRYPNNKKSRFHTGTRFHRTQRSGARASRHPPRWRAQSDFPETGHGRRVDQWQQINPPFPFPGTRGMRGPVGQ